MRPDLIVKNRKLNRLIGVVGVILSVVMFFLAMWNIGWLYRLVGFPAILLIIYAFWYFWLILLAFTLLYNLVHLIVRIKIERGPTNREL